MDPVLTGSLCFLVLAIALYVRFVRLQPWINDDTGHTRKMSPSTHEDSIPFLQPAASPRPPSSSSDDEHAAVTSAHSPSQALHRFRRSPPMRRRAHSATVRIEDEASVEQYKLTDTHTQQPPSSGGQSQQHRINFGDVESSDSERHDDGRVRSRDSDLESRLAPAREEGGKRLVRHKSEDLSGLLHPPTDMSVATKEADGGKHFPRDTQITQPAQMQLEMAKKAQIPLFLHSPMYVRTSAAPLMEEPAAVVEKSSPKERKASKVPRKGSTSSLQIDYAELQIGEMIGQGAFGTVHRGAWRGTEVAVKVLVCQHLTADILEEFEAEVQIMSILRHPNICLMMGACLQPPTRCLVIEYLPKGSLWNVLRQDYIIDEKLQLQFARDTALGMNYLHSFHPPILHRDLKSPNLLVSSSFSIKISDFGLARVRTHFQTMTGNCGTTQWMAPEVLAAEKYTEKADVFSFGVVVWETITRQCPYEGLSQIQAALGVLNNKLRPVIPDNCPPLLEQLMLDCWQMPPDTRPTFEHVLDQLNRANGVAPMLSSDKQGEDSISNKV